MLKTKHNKKRNTAFLYEAIIREITKAIIDQDKYKKKSLVDLCKKYLFSGTELKKELDLYTAIYETNNMDQNSAERLLNEAKLQYEMLDKNKIFDEQTILINELNRVTLGKIFSNFIPDYKNLATISQIFNNTTPIKEKILLESMMLQKMISSIEETNNNKMETLDSLTYKLFVRKFNEQYSESLLKEQKDLITKYVMSFADNGVEFKIFLNEEISRLKDAVNDSLEDKSMLLDEVMRTKTSLILNKMFEYKNKQIDTQLIGEVLQIQNLVKEINSQET